MKKTRKTKRAEDNEVIDDLKNKLRLETERSKHHEGRKITAIVALEDIERLLSKFAEDVRECLLRRFNK